MDRLWTPATPAYLSPHRRHYQLTSLITSCPRIPADLVVLLSDGTGV